MGIDSRYHQCFRLREVSIFTKTQLKNEILRMNKNSPLLSLDTISKLVGDSNPQRVKRKFLKDLVRINGDYFILDVVDRLMEHMSY